MNAPDGLGRETREVLAAIGGADLVVGVPSYQNARTIGHVVRAVQTGLAKYYPDARAVVFNADGGSVDGTPEAVREAVAPDGSVVLVGESRAPLFRFSMPYHGVPGKGSAFRAILAAARQLDARACCVVDADLRSITPEWTHLLLAPVVEQGFDYVAPLYQRHRFDGTITNTIVYPVTRALYGRRIRQPIGGDFGLSAAMFRHLLSRDEWDGDVVRFGVDIWMTTTALASGFRVCQAYLGAKLHDPKDPGSDLSSMLVQVVGTVFRLMETYERQWHEAGASTDVPLFGFRYDVGLDPITVDVARMVAHYWRGLDDLGDLWRRVFDAGTFRQLRLTSGTGGPPALNDDLWARIIYDLAVAYHARTIDREHLLRASLPLYMGRVAAFVTELRDAAPPLVEARIEQACQAFERQKDHLRRRWAGQA